MATDERTHRRTELGDGGATVYVSPTVDFLLLFGLTVLLALLGASILFP